MQIENLKEITLTKEILPKNTQVVLFSDGRDSTLLASLAIAPYTTAISLET